MCVANAAIYFKLKVSDVDVDHWFWLSFDADDDDKSVTCWPARDGAPQIFVLLWQERLATYTTRNNNKKRMNDVLRMKRSVYRAFCFMVCHLLKSSGKKCIYHLMLFRFYVELVKIEHARTCKLLVSMVTIFLFCWLPLSIFNLALPSIRSGLVSMNKWSKFFCEPKSRCVLYWFSDGEEDSNHTLKLFTGQLLSTITPSLLSLVPAIF